MDRDAGGYVMVLRDAIDQKLAIQGLRMSQPGTPGAVEISAAITEIRRVSRASRTVFGSFAGQAGITVSVTLVEASSERVIGSFVAEGKSSAGTIFAGTTDQAVDQVATQIANYIMRTRSGG